MPAHTIAENLTRLTTARTNIADAIIAKGGTVTAGDGFEEFPADIATIPSGGGGSAGMSDVNFYDYDGTIVDSYTASEFATLTAMPSNPSHEGLTAQGWNWSLADAKSYVADYGKLNIGQMYNTSDGKTRIYITLGDGRLEPYLGLGINGSVDVDWGDGSAHDTMTGSSLISLVSKSHEYATAGDYVIVLAVTGEIAFLYTYSGGASLLTRNHSSADYNAVYRNAIRRVNLGSGVTSVRQYAFSSCYALTSITIPSGVTSIEQYAFADCNSVTSIIIPDGVTSISNNVFSSCYSLTSIIIPNSVTSIGNNVFSSCYSLTSIIIPDGVTSISNNAFSGCYSLTSIIIPNGVTSIKQNAFNICRSLTSITIPNSVTSIGNNTFSNCYSLTSITIPNGVTFIDNAAFSNCYSLTSITIPDSVTSIGGDTFGGCLGLAYINLNTYEGAIEGAPWGAPSSDTTVNWLKTARFTKSVNEITSGTTLTTSISCSVGDLIIVTFVVRSDTYTISNDWTLLGISEAVTPVQRTGMAYKIAEATTESITVTQPASGRIYANMVAIQGATLGAFTPFVTQTEGSTITMTRPTGLVVWGVSSYYWSTTAPYPAWAVSNASDIMTIQLPTTTQPRCLMALDQSTDETVSFTTPADNSQLACGYVTVTGISNFIY